MQKLGSLFLILLVAVLVRLSPLLEAPLAAYGYDYGLYLHALKHVETFQLSNLLSAIKGTYESLLFFLTKPFHLAPEATLDSLHFLASVLLPLAFYFYFRKQNKTAAIFGALLSAVSIIQTETYLMFLLKTVLALPLLVLAFKFLEEKRYPWFLFMSLAIFVTHRTTAVVLALTLLGYWGFELIKNPRPARLTVSLGLLAATGFLWGPKLFNAARALFAYPNPARITGIFLENENLFEILWPIAILTAAGFIFSLKAAPKNSIFAVLTSLCLLWIILKLPFYRRMFIYLDLGLIFYAAYFLAFLNYKSRLAKIILIVFLVAVGFNLLNFVFQKTPLISGAEIQEIKKFEAAQGTVLSLSSNDAPWLLGFLPSAAATVFAPGMFADPHTYEDWVAFWAGQNQEQFLAIYNPPLYLYRRSLPGLANTIPCLQKLTENFSLYRCE